MKARDAATRIRTRFGWSPVRNRTGLVFLLHPLEIGLGGVLPALAIVGLFTDVSASLATLPPALYYPYSAISALGGIGLLVGLFWHDPPRQIGFGVALERASLFLVAASYAARGVMVIAVNGSGGIAFGLIALFLGAMFFLRTVAIRRSSKIIIETLEKLRQDQAEECGA